MARVIPATLELLGPNDLLGLILAGKGAEILDLLMRRLNWHYATHAPPLANLCPLNGLINQGQTIEYRWRSNPSADGRTYHSRWAIYLSSGGAQTIDIDLQESTTWGGTYTSVGSYPVIGQALSPGINRLVFDAPLSASTNYLRIELTNLSDDVAQVQNFMLAPKELVSIPLGVQPSGFVGYDDAALLVGSGDPPIHPEYFKRAASGTRATQADLKQCVMSYVQAPTNPAYAFTATATQTVQRMALAPFHVPLTEPTTTTVYCRAADNGTPDGTVRVGQVGSPYEPATFVAGDTDGAEPLVLDPQSPPVLYIDAINPGGRLDIRYVMVELEPDIGSDSPIVSGVAPPPLREYLSALDQLTLEACLRDYAVTGLNFDVELSQSPPVYYLGQQVQPGVSGMQLYAGVSRDNAGTAAQPVVVQTASSGSGGADVIFIESPNGGALVYPPSQYANVAYGSLAWIPTPPGPGGSYRLAELAKDRRPHWEEMYAGYCQALAGKPIRVADPSTLPAP
jgi:hypothetical protein